jgi:hypothetical protein
VALELPHDRGRGEARGRLSPSGLEPLDGVQESDAGDLDEVLERLAAVHMAQRQLCGQRGETV